MTEYWECSICTTLVTDQSTHSYFHDVVNRLQQRAVSPLPSPTWIPFDGTAGTSGTVTWTSSDTTYVPHLGLPTYRRHLLVGGPDE